MSTTDRNILKQWFMRYAKPTAAQFAAWIDSYWHKDDKIPLTSIENLQGEFDKKADREYIDNSLVVTIENAKSYTNEKVAVEAASRQAEMAAAIATEADARQQGDADTLSTAEQAADSKVAAHNADEVAHADIRQAVAAEATARQQGDVDTLSAAVQAADSKVAAHNTDEAAHADIRQAVADEATARQQSEHTLDNKIAGVNSTVGTLAGDFDTHNNDEVRHVTPDDRARWDNRDIAKVFDTEQDMRNWVAGNGATLAVGQGLKIKDVNAPDYWWDGALPQLSKTKTDLSDYYSKAETDTKDEQLLQSADAYTDSEVAAECQRAVGVEAGKAERVHTHSRAEITDFPGAMPPIGAAGGSLSGSYPNPSIAAGTIVDSHIAGNAAISQSKISGLQDSLANKLSSIVVNNTRYSAITGSVVLPTYPTSLPANGGSADQTKTIILGNNDNITMYVLGLPVGVNKTILGYDNQGNPLRSTAFSYPGNTFVYNITVDGSENGSWKSIHIEASVTNVDDIASTNLVTGMKWTRIIDTVLGDTGWIKHPKQWHGTQAQYDNLYYKDATGNTEYNIYEN